MDRDELLSSAAQDCAAIAVLAQAAAPTTPVPSCPAWTLHDLTWHVATRPPIWLALLALDPDASPDLGRLAALSAGGAVADTDPIEWATSSARSSATC